MAAVDSNPLGNQPWQTALSSSANGPLVWIAIDAQDRHSHNSAEMNKSPFRRSTTGEIASPRCILRTMKVRFQIPPLDRHQAHLVHDSRSMLGMSGLNDKPTRCMPSIRYSQKLGDSPRVFFENSVVANQHGYWIRRKNQGLELEQKRLSRCGTAMHVSSVSS